LKNYKKFAILSVLAVILAAAIFLRISLQRRIFNQAVRKASRTTASYDKMLISKVNRMEADLAMRASFSYEGGKDPMTGKKRMVVLQAKQTKAKTPDNAQRDPVKLTAIIFDDKTGGYTAIVMDGERSYSVGVGESVGKRTIRKITDEYLIMEGDSLLYKYDIYGKSETKHRASVKEK
jgi:hypothetical protein